MGYGALCQAGGREFQSRHSRHSKKSLSLKRRVFYYTSFQNRSQAPRYLYPMLSLKVIDSFADNLLKFQWLVMPIWNYNRLFSLVSCPCKTGGFSGAF